MSLGLRLGIGGMRLSGADAEEEGLLRLCVQVVAGGFGSLGGNGSVGELAVVGVGEGSRLVGNEVFYAAVGRLITVPAEHPGQVALWMREGETAVGQAEHATAVRIFAGEEGGTTG